MQKSSTGFSLLVFLLFSLSSIHAYGTRETDVKLEDMSHNSGRLGDYKALIIGIDQYRDKGIPNLHMAVNDAREISQLLKRSYGFQTTLLLDERASRRNIYNVLRLLASESEESDSVLIYFAGHGDMDRQYNDGWWIPSDARAGDPTTYLENVQVQMAMRAMKARHVLLISDSCYSGTLFGTSRSAPPVINDRYYLSLYNEKSRWGMTSGNREPVADRGTDGHSIFAYQLLKVLEKNKHPFLSTQDIYTKIAPIIANNSEQTPLCRPIRNTGDQGGEFIFVRLAETTPAIVSETPPLYREEPPRSTLKITSQPSGASVYIDGKTAGKTPLKFKDMVPGKVLITVEQQGFLSQSKQVNLHAGRRKVMDFDLVPEQKNGWLTVNASPKSAVVKIMNIRERYSPGMELTAGSYRLQVEATGYKTEQRTIELAAGDDVSIAFHLEEKAEPPVVSVTPTKLPPPLPAKTSPEPLKKTSPPPPDTATKSSDIAGADYTEPHTGMEFVFIKGGCYSMGQTAEEQQQLTRKLGEETYNRYFTDELPLHEVCVDDLFMGKFEVNQKEFKKIMGSSPSSLKKGGLYPVETVSWEDVQTFIEKLNTKSEKKFRLPTEAEWEYGARAKAATSRYWGNSIDCENANYENDPGSSENSCVQWLKNRGIASGSTVTAGSYGPNSYGLYDMLGNVWEWCADRYDAQFYAISPRSNPKGPDKGNTRVIRGGSWYVNGSYLRAANRRGLEQTHRDSSVGFRLVFSSK